MEFEEEKKSIQKQEDIMEALTYKQRKMDE